MNKPHRWLRWPQCCAAMATPSSALELRHPPGEPSRLRNRSVELLLSLPHRNPNTASKWLRQPLWLLHTLSGAVLSLLVLLCLCAMYSRPRSEVPLSNCPSLQLRSLARFSQHTSPEKNRTFFYLLVYLQLTLKPPLYFSCWWINDRDLISNQWLRLELAWSLSLRTFSPIF